MRKAQKREVLEFIQNLQRAHGEVKEAIHRQDYTSAQKMLGECQDFAVSLGGIIEKTEGDGHITVSYLEEYCEALFRVYEEIGDGIAGRDEKPVNENRISRILRQHIVQVENSVKNDIAIKKEIIFLPYKASMWDSLESIWMTEKDKPENDTYVIPIPYFDRNPDGSFRQMHYEGKQYPDYVPVTDWRNYDIAQRRPDVIYIHNSYDQYNYVTSVHPDFYTARLKQFTEMLVYSPYFVGINNHVAEHLCTLPGILYVDKVLVESEEVKKIYIKALRKYEKENRCVGRFGSLNEKIQVSRYGSPKVDRIKRIKKADLEIPAEWKEMIQNDDGSKRKIILYNTTVDAALNSSEEFLGKIRRVLSVFEGNRKVVLLWRPHPLLLPTLYSMRPDLYQEMLDIIDIYKKEAKGIFDDTVDIDRAILLSDAYYGDMSSVVTLYRTIGKPIMIQNYKT